jgi:hypothetical protein
LTQTPPVTSKPTGFLVPVADVFANPAGEGTVIASGPANCSTFPSCSAWASMFV